MNILIIDNDRSNEDDKKKIEILMEKSIKSLKIIYETDTEKHIVIHNNEVAKKTDAFFENHKLNSSYRSLIQILLQTASIYNNIETIYQVVSEELDMSVRLIRLRLVTIKNALGYTYIHPDLFLKKLIGEGLPEKKNIKLFNT
ncbi:MAG: hypothetical protein MJA82_01675 [Clostridia bacterium]|nr:hypothetical protein [Clostridia bacterium]